MKQTTIGVLRHSRFLRRMIFVISVLTCVFSSTNAQTADSIIRRGYSKEDASLDVLGGKGGGKFVARCPQGQLLHGFQLWTGDDVDGIRVLCVTASGPSEAGLYVAGGETFGGTGTTGRYLTCPQDAPIVIGMYVNAEGYRTTIVNNIHLWCGVAGPTQKRSVNPNVRFDGPVAQCNGCDLLDVETQDPPQFCPAGLVAVGISGRSGVWLDAVGLTCGEPKLKPGASPPQPVKVIGRVEVPPGSAPNLTISICESARRARARNSPAAPGLEAQCSAAGAKGETPPVRAIGRMEVPSGTTNNPPTLICESAQQARARNSPAAPGLEAKCLDDLAVKGEAVAIQDPLAAELRNRESEGAGRRGFDIGMAATEGETAPGPGKQRIHDSLDPAEQAGFNIAVAFSLERNRNADLAARGAAIARSDTGVMDGRTADGNVFYWLGFDIATGIFGDPWRGAQGKTTMTPTSQQIRDSLSAAGQRGFDASVKLHLSRRYRRR